VAYYEGTAPEDVPDNVSLAPTDMSTSASLFTRYTNRTGGTMNTHTTRNTSKNRRREERKRARGKKGSVYEEEYLVNSLRRLIERVNSVRDDIARLVEALVRRRMWERAVAVEKAMLDMVDLCKACLGEVFVAAGEDQQTAGAGHTAATLSPTSIPAVSTAHGDDAETGSREYGRGLSALVPVVLPFERLSLI
jgi:elongator complex protein 1